MKTIRMAGGDAGLEIFSPDGRKAAVSRTRQGDRDVLTIRLDYAGAYGMGEKFNGLNQKGKTSVNQVVEKFCHQGHYTYLPAPFFVTDAGIGLYVDTKRETEFSFGDEIVCRIPPEADAVFFSGAVPEVISAYMERFGPAKLPPAYAFGIWISANRWHCQEDVERQLELLERYDFPATVMVLEAWSDEATFYIWNGASYEPRPDGEALSPEDFDFSKSPWWKDPQGMIRTLHEKGIRLVLWQIPAYKRLEKWEPPCRQLELDQEDAVRRRLCVMLEGGEPYRIPEGNWFSGSLIPDFTNPLTRRVWFEKRRYLLEMGVDGFKTDGGEFIYRRDLKLSGGEDGEEAKNAYARAYTEAYSDFVGPKGVLFSRAGFSGAHRAPIHWAGDQQSENGELKSVLGAGLSAAMTGIPFWSFDIGGFAGPLPSLDLYRRATQLACFAPVMQWHSEPDGGQFADLMPGAEGNNERSPWNVADARGCPEFVEEIRFWHRLRMNLHPYLYGTARDCCRENRPMMRTLVYEWAQLAEAVEAEDEFLLGESLLVAPLLEEGAAGRRLWFPPGEWYGLFTRKKYDGCRQAESDPGEKFPVYLRSGRAVALRGAARDGLGAGERKDGDAQEIHCLLAGPGGTYRLAREEGDIALSWNENEVRYEGPDDVRITWERMA